MPAYTSTPGKSKAVQSYGGKVTKKRPGVALGPAPAPSSPIYSSSGTSGATSTTSSGATSASSSSRPSRTPAQRRASRIRKVARITKDPKPKKVTKPKALRKDKQSQPQKMKSPGLARNERSLPTATLEPSPRIKDVAKAIIAPGKPTKIRAPEKPKIQGRKEKLVAKRLTKAARRSQGGLAKKLDRGFGPNETITPRQAAIVAESEGLPGKTYAQIGKGESGLRPGAANPDDGYKSLWQMTPSVQSTETLSKWDKIASKRKGGSTNPIVAAKQAKVLAGSGTGVSNYYGTGFVTDENAHLPGGEKRADKLLYGKKKPIPKTLKRKATKVLGKEAAKKIVKQAKKPVSSGVDQKKGPWEGAQRAVLSVVPKAVRSEGRGDKRTPEENASVGGATASDHLTTNTGSYAADLPPDDAVARKIAKRLGMASHTGTNEVTKNGYRYQLIWQDAGHYDHIHLGAQWTGEGASPSASSAGTGAGVSMGTTSSGGTTTSSGKGTTTTKKARRRSERARSRKQLLNEILNAPDAQAADPLEGYTRPATRTATRTSIGL